MPLKPIPSGNKGLPKLPKAIRNRMGFMADGGGVEQVTQLKPIYTKRDKKGYRFYVDVNDGNKIYAEKDGKLFKVNDDMKPSVPAVRAYQKQDRKSTRLNSSHVSESRMPSSA